jgi:hypothetical protein
MHILTLALIFVVGAIAAACHGDFSGIWAILKWAVFAGLIILFIFHPEILIIAGIIIVAIMLWTLGDGNKDDKDDLTIH